MRQFTFEKNSELEINGQNIEDLEVYNGDTFATLTSKNGENKLTWEVNGDEEEYWFEMVSYSWNDEHNRFLEQSHFDECIYELPKNEHAMKEEMISMYEQVFTD